MELLEAAQHWRNLAEYELRLAEINARYGNTDTYRVRADLYARCAKALEQEAKTGIPVCIKCFEPLSGLASNIHYCKG